MDSRKTALHPSFQVPEVPVGDDEGRDDDGEAPKRPQTAREALETLRELGGDAGGGGRGRREGDHIVGRWQLLSKSDLLALAMTSCSATEGDAEMAARLSDLAAAAFQSADLSAVEAVLDRTVRAVWLTLLSSRAAPPCHGPVVPLCVRARLLERVCSRFSGVDKVAGDLASGLTRAGVSVEEEVLFLAGQRRAAVLRTMVRGSKDAGDLEAVLGKRVASECLSDFGTIAFSTGCRTGNVASRLCCYLGSCLPGKEAFSLLERALELWADPVVARAYVSREVVHCTRLVLLLFCHLDREATLQRESRLVELLAGGLPNHFNSSDGRTVELAKYLSEIVMETLRHYKEDDHPLPENLLRPEASICQELLSCLHDCERTKSFWIKPPRELVAVGQSPPSIPSVARDRGTHDVVDSDDDSDLEPVESLDPPVDSKIKYLRNFLEDVPGMKEHAEVLEAFQALPRIARRQLVHEHLSLGEQLLDYVFLWENEFDDPALDRHRRAALTSVVATRPVDYLRPFCLMFHRDQVQPYRKNDVLEVLGEVSKELDLKGLGLMAETVFSSLVLHEGTVADQDVTVRIPLILFLSQTICSLPPEMVTEEMLLTFLGSVRGLRHVDGATEQTICYALSSVMASLGTKKISPRVREGVTQARNWILAMQMER